MRRLAALCPLVRTAARRLATAAVNQPLITDPAAAAQTSNWTPDFLMPTNFGKFARFSDEFMKLVPGIPPNMATQFKLVSYPALMLRKSTAQIIDAVKTEAQKDKCTTAFFLDGARGNGKSSAILHAVSHYKSQGWIVIYFPRLGQWISGIEPYEKAADADMYYQHPLAAKLLAQILEWNGPQLKKISAADGSRRSAADLARAGAADNEHAHGAFEQVVQAVLSAKDRPPVLIALDQVGALFRTTTYHDAESNPLSTDKFALPHFMHRIMANLEHPNMAILAACDRTEPQTFSFYLDHILKTTEPMNSDHGLLNSDLCLDSQIDQLASRDDEHRVILPAILDRTYNDLFTRNNRIDLTNVSRFVVPAYDMHETAHAIQFYRGNNVLYRDVTEKLIKTRYMITQGNPLDVFKSCIAI